MKRAFLSSLMLALLFINRTSAGAAQPVPARHGTVNIILANKNGLVAVTDSMLTWLDGEGHAHHEPSGIKLYKLDDKTVCTIAGLYDNPVDPALTALEASIPDIMADVVKELNSSQFTFRDKFGVLAHLFAHRFSANLQAAAALSPKLDLTLIQPVELTMAGYGSEGRLEVGAFMLVAERKPEGLYFYAHPRGHGLSWPVCEAQGREDQVPSEFSDRIKGLPKPRFVGDSWFCVLAGVVSVAESILDMPSQRSDAPGAVKVYAQARERKNLALQDIKNLAIELEEQTAAFEKRNGELLVGGAPQVAVLDKGGISEVLLPFPNPKGVGGALSGNAMNFGTQVCTNDVIPLNKNVGLGGSLSGKFINCKVVLDDVTIHDSSFKNSVLVYEGVGSLLFDQMNKVDSSTLLLGHIDVARPEVARLVCSYRWTAIYPDPKLPCEALGFLPLR